jgi:hypothetical protein
VRFALPSLIAALAQVATSRLEGIIETAPIPMKSAR